MPSYSYQPGSSARRRQAEPDDEPDRGVIQFPVPPRAAPEPESLGRRTRQVVEDPEPRQAPPRRSTRRRRQSSTWLQRNALNIAAASVLIALLGLAFGVLQLISRPDSSPSPAATGTEQTVESTTVAAANAVAPVAQASAPTAAPRQIVASARVIEPNYTVAQGDTLAQIAARFNTSVERIQALNNLSDPRSLRIGTKLVVPPAL
jgi:LysM repeat protein